MSEDTGETLDLQLGRDIPADVGQDATALDGDSVEPEPAVVDRHDATTPSDDDSVKPTTADAVDQTAKKDRVDSPAMFLTNRFNLLTSLGARLIQPQSGYRKYRPDTLTQTPGEVPIVDGPPSRSMIEEMESGRNAFPVLVELGDLDGLQVTRADGLGRTVVGSVPLRRATAIHVPDEQSLREHRARPYNNIYPHDDLLRVTPELFAAEVDRTTWSTSREPVPEQDWFRIDRLRGAVNSMRASASSPRTLEAVARVLGADETTAAAKTATPWLDGLLDPTSQKGKGAEDILFSAVMTVLMRTDTQEDWSPRSVLDEVQKQALEKAPKRAAATLQKNIEHARTVLIGEKEFTPYKSGSTGLTTAKALLLVLLRENLESLLNWSPIETGADDITMQTAAVYAGALRGLLREDTALRDKDFDDLTAEWAALGQVALQHATVTFETNENRSVLAVNGDVVRDIPAPPPSPSVLLQKLPADDLEPARLELAKQLEWSDLISTKAVWNGPITVQSRGGKTVVTGSLAGTEENIDVEKFNERLDTEPGARDAVLKLVELEEPQ